MTPEQFIAGLGEKISEWIDGYTSSTWRERQIVRVSLHAESGESVGDFANTIDEALEFFHDLNERVPPEYRGENARVRIHYEPEDGHGGGGYVNFAVWYERPEKDEEFMGRVGKLVATANEHLRYAKARELEMLAALKQKYEGKK